MLQIIIILIVLVTSISKGFAQTELGKELLKLEYEIFNCSDDTQNNDLLLQKVNLLLANNEYLQSLNEAKRINYSFIRDTLKRKYFLWNTTLLSQLNKDKDYAQYYYHIYQELYPDTGIEANLLGILIHHQIDTVFLIKSTQYLTSLDKRFECLGCLNEISDYKRKNKNFYIISSALIPGMGTALNGNITKGATSLLLNTAMGYAIFIMAKQNLYLNAVLWSLTLGYKLYIGNLQLTNHMFVEKELMKRNEISAKCQFKVNSILNEYPISFQ